MARLCREFYLQDTLTAAQALLGKYLVRRLGGEILAVRITETEGYIGRCDQACHAYNYRRTPRTDTLFRQAGTAYIYFIYGMYHCLNFVTEPEGEPAAVLIRAGEPILGADTIQHLRFGDKPLTAYRKKNFLNGPGKLCKGLSLTKEQNGLDLVTGEDLFVCDDPGDLGLPALEVSRERMCRGKRIGVDYAGEARDYPWRFWLEKEE